uniref:Protein suppressor of hairy wing n=1 Tax=Culex pipiens TaxID=7175 RepID=A0A8D8FAX3_CULPI
MAASNQLSVRCRLCLQQSDQLEDIFGPAGDGGSSLHMRIMASVSLEIHRSDNLPKGVCSGCRYQLEKTYIFRSRCRNNDTRLRRHVKLVAAGKVSRLLEEAEEDEDDEFEASLEYIREVDEREKEREKARWDEKVATFEEEFRAVAELQRNTLYNEVRNELLSKRDEERVEVGTMTADEEAEIEVEIPEEMEEDAPVEEEQESEPLNIKIMDCYSVAEQTVSDPKKKLREQIHARLAKQDEEMIQYLEEERLENESMEVLDEVTADQFIITEVSDSETYVVDTDNRLHEEQDMYGSDDDSDEDLEAVTNAVKAELAERPNLTVDENCVMKVEKTRDLTKVEVRATDGSLICMEFSRERSSPTPTPNSTFHMKLAGHEYVCPNCPLTFNNARTLGMHTCLAKDAKQYPCDVCGKVFPTNQTLKRHYRIHTGEKPFSCMLCDKSFTQKEVLKRHMVTHSGTRPHACEHCERRFIQKDQLRHHINRCHSENPVITLHKCHICHKTFKHASGLSRHTATHLGRTYPCGVCKKEFNDKSALKRHEYALHGPEAGMKKGGAANATVTKG